MSGPRSVTANVVHFALAVLVAAVALHLAADLLRTALPVLIPLGVLMLVSLGVWRWHTRSRGW